jgi:hypothetical protein
MLVPALLELPRGNFGNFVRAPGEEGGGGSKHDEVKGLRERVHSSVSPEEWMGFSPGVFIDT